MEFAQGIRAKSPREFWKESFSPCTGIIPGLHCVRERKGRKTDSGGRRKGRTKVKRKKVERGKKREERPISSAVEFHERAIAADVRSAEELCGREIPRE